MLYIEGELRNSIYNGKHRIVKGYFKNDIIYDYYKDAEIIGQRELNVAEEVEYSMLLKGKEYKDLTISCDSKNAIINHNIVSFFEEGNYTLTITYKKFQTNINVSVDNIKILIL